MKLKLLALALIAVTVSCKSKITKAGNHLEAEILLLTNDELKLNLLDKKEDVIRAKEIKSNKVLKP